MYDHPIKRAGLTFNRILYSNTVMALPGLPAGTENRLRVNYKVKYYDLGKEVNRKYFNSKSLDEIFPTRRLSAAQL